MQEGKGCNKENKQVGISIHLTHTMNGVCVCGGGGDGIIYIQLRAGFRGYISRMLTKILETRSTTNGLWPKARDLSKGPPSKPFKTDNNVETQELYHEPL